MYPFHLGLRAKSFKFTRIQSISHQFISSTQMSTESTNLNSVGPIGTIIKQKLSTELLPDFLEIVNESYKHNVPPNSESHFKVLVVSKHFEGKSILDRHRTVNRILSEELKVSIHALSIQALTTEQWQLNPTVHTTPNCLGGGAKK